MLRVVAPYVAEMLQLKLLTFNVVAGVAGFLSISHLSHPIPWARMADGRWRIEQPNRAKSHLIVVNRAKSSQIAFGGRPSRPQQCDFAPLPPRIRMLCNEPPPLSALPGNPAKSHLIVPNPDSQVHGHRPDRRTDSELLSRHTVFGWRGRFLKPSMPLTAEFQFVTPLYDSVQRSKM
jgi:hypothetical protein